MAAEPDTRKRVASAGIRAGTHERARIAQDRRFAWKAQTPRRRRRCPWLFPGARPARYGTRIVSGREGMAPRFGGTDSQWECIRVGTLHLKPRAPGPAAGPHV